jgi:hypothetical protein
MIIHPKFSLACRVGDRPAPGLVRPAPNIHFVPRSSIFFKSLDNLFKKGFIEADEVFLKGFISEDSFIG